MSAQMHAQAVSFGKLHESLWNYFLCYETNKEALNVLCSVAKHLRGGQSTQEAGRFSSMSCVFLTSFVL